MADVPDWQISCKSIQERGKQLLDSGLWSDCKFVVGMEPNQQVIECHKLFLAMASPVFQAMFYGGMPENKPITILDVQPEAFKALLEYIYTDKINLTSFDQACELCYGAKKYMLPHLVEGCTRYLWADIKPKNACRAYEFAKLFEEPKLMEKCMMIIQNETADVLRDSTFEDVEIDTILTIFDQNYLTVGSELELFEALTRHVAKQNSSGANGKVPRLDLGSSTSGDSPSAPGSSRSPSVRDCLMKIRFLTLTPQQFAEGPATSSLLTQNEKFALLMNISSTSSDVSMPPGFSKNNAHRRCSYIEADDRDRFLTMDYPQKQYCTRKLLRQVEFHNLTVSDCTVSFQCERNVCIYGIQVPAQIRAAGEDSVGDVLRRPYLCYSELLYAHLLDGDDARLTYTHFTSRVQYFSLIDICFNRPVFIQKNKVYKVGVVLNKSGWYPIGTYPSHTVVNGAVFTFLPLQDSHDFREGLVRSLIFTYPTPTTDTALVDDNEDL